MCNKFACVCDRSKLEACVLQWQDYDTVYETISNWVKDTEVKVRNEAGLQRDLKAKQRQVEQFEVENRWQLYLFFLCIKSDSLLPINIKNACGILCIGSLTYVQYIHMHFPTSIMHLILRNPQIVQMAV